MVHLGILAHELSQLEGKPDQYTGFPTDIKNIGGGGGGRGEHRGGGGGGGGGSSQYMGSMGRLPRKEKISC